MLPVTPSFNSRARKGRDFAENTSWPPFGGFNSRARKGRDTRPLALQIGKHCFNSRARKGRDISPLISPPNPRLFQFTRPQGARPPMRGGIRL